MKYLSKFTVVFLLGIISLFAQAPDTAWTRTYGGIYFDQGYSVQQTADGGYIVAGESDFGIPDDENVYLIKTNSLGDTLWTKTYRDSSYDYSHSVVQTTDGGYIVAGVTDSLVYLIKTDTLGDTLWTRTYGVYDDNLGYSVQQTSDGGYIIAGDAYSEIQVNEDVYLIKTDSLGHTLWEKTYGGFDESETGYSVQQTTDGGYIIAGETSSYGAGGYDVYLIKTDTIGDTLWTKTYGGTEDDKGHSVQQTTDGGYIIAGETDSYGAGDKDVYLIKTDTIGDTLWTKTYGGTEDDRSYSVQQTTDGGYIVAGFTKSYGAGEYDVYLIKTDSLGDSLWTKTCGGEDGDEGFSVQQTTDGGYIVAGITFSYGVGGGDAYLVKIKPEGSGIKEKIITGLFSISKANPNPFITKTTVNYELTKETNMSISVYNMLGQKVIDLYSGRQSSGVHSVTWDGSGDSGKLPTGIYLIKIQAGDEETSLKLTLIR